MFAYIQDGIVFEISSLDLATMGTFAGISSIAILPAHGTVEVDYTYDSNTDTFAAPTHSLQEYKDAVTENCGYQKAIGVTINTEPFYTSPAAVSEIAMLLQSAMTSYSYQLANGTVVTYTQAQLTDRYNAILTYHNACMANVATLHTALDAASDPADVDLDVGWPSTTLTV